jgi:hypothetical protein
MESTIMTHEDNTMAKATTHTAPQITYATICAILATDGEALLTVTDQIDGSVTDHHIVGDGKGRFAIRDDRAAQYRRKYRYAGYSMGREAALDYLSYPGDLARYIAQLTVNSCRITAVA